MIGQQAAHTSWWASAPQRLVSSTIASKSSLPSSGRMLLVLMAPSLPLVSSCSTTAAMRGCRSCRGDIASGAGLVRSPSSLAALLLLGTMAPLLRPESAAVLKSPRGPCKTREAPFTLQGTTVLVCMLARASLQRC